MGKSPITCSKILDGCGATCLEVAHHRVTPRKLEKEKKAQKSGRLYYYFCPECGMEWIQDILGYQIHPKTDGSIQRLKLFYEFEDLQGLSSAGLNPIVRTQDPPDNRVFSKGDVPSDRLLLKVPGWDKPQAVPKIVSMSGYRAAVEKVGNLAEMEVSKDSYMYVDLLATLLGIFEYELKNKELDGGIILSGEAYAGHKKIGKANRKD